MTMLEQVKKGIKYRIRRTAMLTKFKLGRKMEVIPKKNEFRGNVTEYFNLPGNPSANVIFVVVDCLRFRSTSISNYERDTTPFLKTFGKQFKAIAGAPWTYPSVPTILTGQYPHNHKAYLRGRFKDFRKPSDLKPLHRSIPLISDVLEKIGYKTYFATAIDPVLYSVYGRTEIRWYHYLSPAEMLFNDFLKWVETKRDSPFFAYVHLADPHEPLNPPKRFKNYFGRVKNLPNVDTWNYHFDWERNKDPEGFEKYKNNRILFYDNTVRYVDWAIENFVNSLKRLGVLDDTLIIITADHGEEFWEHAETEAKHFKHAKGWSGISHGHNVFNEIVEVPLVLGGAFEGEALKEGLRSLADLVPTVLDVLGVEYPNGYFDGVSLKKGRKRGILTEAASSGYEKKALYWKEFKFLYAPEDGVKWVFNLKKDPNEQKPITDPQITEIFEQKIKKILSRFPTARLRWGL